LALLSVGLSAGVLPAKDEPAYEPGLMAYYFSDPVNWDGNWPDATNAPAANPTDWTFSEYGYSRVEPVINHEFIKRGWFSVRWKGFLDTSVTDADRGAGSVVEGSLNVNPDSSVRNAFVLSLPDGRNFSDEDLRRDGFVGYSGAVARVTVKPKGNSDDNMLLVDGAPYPLRNGETYEIAGPAIEAVLTHASEGSSLPAGQWWLRIAASNATVRATYDKLMPAIEAGAKTDGRAEYVFEIHADDGCRLYIDGKVLVDDWVACWEKSPRSLRRSPPVLLTEGMHEIVVEYFQGQSLEEGDSDPMRLYWACPQRNLPRQLVRPAHFFHAAQSN
jgi:hypothetical protein